MALFLFGVLAPIAGTWGAKAHAAGSALGDEYGIKFDSDNKPIITKDSYKLEWIDAGQLQITFKPGLTDKVVRKEMFVPKNEVGGKSTLVDQRSVQGGKKVEMDYEIVGWGCYSRAHRSYIGDSEPITDLQINIDFKQSPGAECDGGGDVQIPTAKPGLSIAWWQWVDASTIENINGSRYAGTFRITDPAMPDVFFNISTPERECNDRLWVNFNRNEVQSFELSRSTSANKQAPQHIKAGRCQYFLNADSPPSGGPYGAFGREIAGIANKSKPKATGVSANGGTSSTPTLSLCDANGNPLTWIICPIVNGAMDMVRALNGTINSLLTLPTDKLFDTEKSTVAGNFYASWSGFRYIAMGLLVIIALIMVLSQAIGVGPFDAYTVRKVLPRLLAAVVLVSLSWPLMKLAVEITNGIGHSISGLIYGPFSGNLENNNPSILVMGTAAIGGIIGAFTFGLFGTLAFVATAALSMISGMATLIFREMLIMFLVVVAPVAIICSILPNTQTVWKKWSDYFLRALIVFPIFSGVIAIGQVFAVLGSQLHDDTLGSIISFAGYFGPYFMLPKIFAMSGGAVAAVGSVAQKATAGMRGGLKGFSQNRRKQIHENRMNAKGRLGGSSAGGVYRRLASGGAHGSWSMREGGREKWKAKEKKTLATSSAEMLKEGGDAAFADDDASSLLRINGLSKQEFIDGYTSIPLPGGGFHTETEANAALGRAEIATGAKVGTTAMATAATAYRHSVSTTAFLPTTAGKMQQRNELRYAVAEGLITQDDATILQKSNKGRLDQSAGGFMEGKGFLFGTGPHAAMTADEHTANAFKNSDPREILAANPKTSEAFAVVALNNGIAAVAGGIPQEVDRRLGDLANIHSSMSSTSPARANEFEATVLSRPSGIMGTRPDPMDKTKRVSKELTWREAIDDARADEPGHSTFHDRIREYSRDPSGFSSDSRLKRNIQQLGVSVSGIKIYKFQYIWSDVEYVGVLAQELLSEHRHAVIVDDSGYYKVDYSKIDVEMMLYKDWKHRVMASN